MRCCAPGCKNDSRHLSKSQGITFHVFPTETSLRRAWLKAVGKEEWEPKERSAICSDHFSEEDLYETRSGLRKVRNGAVPIAVQDASSSMYTHPVNLNVCRICLTTTGKLYAIRKHKLEHAYEHLTGVILGEEDSLPQKLCVECAHRLTSSDKFRSKSLRANTLLTDLVERHDFLTMRLIKSIDRQFHQLSSTLSSKHFTDQYDLTIEHSDTSDAIVDDVEIKVETVDESFLNENIFEQEPIKPDGLSEENCQEIVEAVTYPIGPEAVEELADDGEHPRDDDQFATELGFSSDDSIPLQLARRTKQLKRKKSKLQKENSSKKVRRRQLKEEVNEPKVDRRRKPFLNADLNETLFTITDLTFDEQIAEILKRQESANYKNAVFKCTECYKGFLDEDAYNGHMSRHTKECGDYRCDICKTHFKHPHALRKHITAHHTQRFSCNQCPYVTTHRQTARLHERWHKGTKYQCPHCPDEFVKFTTYMGHIRIKHPSDFVCALCGFSFVSEKGIELHKKLKHRTDTYEVPEDGPMCELCNVRFVSAEAHDQHLRVSARHNHADKDTRESNKPKKGRKTKEAKERERRAREKNEEEEEKRLYPSQVRKAEGPITCEQCGIQVEDSRAYHGHFRRAHPDKNRTNYPSMKAPCMCEVCGRMFQSYALLKDHRWVHTGERPFKCEQCGKSFRMKQRLVAHRRVHSSVKASYVCDLCGKHFSTHSNRQRHMFIHTGLKPFKCEMCGKSFKHSSEKRAHITYVHLKKPWPKRSRGKRQGIPAQASAPNSGSELDIPQPLWACDPKMDHINTIMEDKPMYYNLKI